MIGRIVEIAGDNRYLSLDRGFLVISHRKEELGRVPIDDVAALIGNAHGLSYSNNLLVALAERGAPFVLCGAHHRPIGVLWPVDGHHRQAARMDAQLSASLPLRKRLWKQITQTKIGMQAAVVGLFGGPEPPLRRLASTVRSGDPSNVEGRAARLYWGLLFGKAFRRDHDGEGINGLLNYGYTVLRATVARQLMGAGLHPGIPLHHANEGNPMRLVDDLMEPFRPLVDAFVRRLVDAGKTEINDETKRTLALLPVRNMLTARGISPVGLVIQRMVVSLAQLYENPENAIELPPATRTALTSLWEESRDSENEEAAN
ncbi:type II CRISPR-associated endonuclease Cas1 [Rhodanobacter ginsengiterrae]|uniref:type II CRISPR-associated endonuclease Cas1 n=1 Tax=Rhodanobacter ginsengiterrae TaxID=2008451 RepID=UPI003CF60BFE